MLRSSLSKNLIENAICQARVCYFDLPGAHTQHWHSDLP